MLDLGLKLCKEIGGHTYIVGGAVRDMLLGSEISDVDIATDVDIDSIVSRFETYDIGKNKDFGIVVVKYEGVDFEVAHFRQDGRYSDNRHPDTVKFVQTIEEDLARRDFTINAMAYDGKKIIDPFDGQGDLKKGLIKFVGLPDERIEEDPLRILRAYRFAARYMFTIDPDAEHHMSNTNLTGLVSQERITQELIKCAGDGSRSLAFFIHRTAVNGIYIIPELQDSHLPQQVKHHPEGDVFSHIVHCLSALDSKDYLTNLCIMFHDIGKYFTLAYKEPTGIPIYYGHDTAGAEQIQILGARLKLSNEDIDTIAFCCRYHMDRRSLQEMSKSKSSKFIFDDRYKYLEQACYADEMSRIYKVDEKRFFEIAATAQKIHAEYKDKKEFESKIKQVFTGNDVMRIRPELVGKDIGIVVDAARDLIIDSNFTIPQNDVFYFIKNYDVENVHSSTVQPESDTARDSSGTCSNGVH